MSLTKKKVHWKDINKFKIERDAYNYAWKVLLHIRHTISRNDRKKGEKKSPENWHWIAITFIFDLIIFQNQE